jgi:hypothetical protein
MAFKIVENTMVDLKEFFVTDDEALTDGQAVKFASGRLTDCDATDSPDGIVVGDVAAGTDQRAQIIPVRVSHLFATTSTVTVAATLVGSKVTLSADSLQVTATTTDGVAYIEYTDGVTDGGVVHVRFADRIDK